jgi:3'(2'), 5'-bisphosphate nucleotidase
MGYKVAAAEATDRMPPALPSHHALRDACSDFARAAAREIMRIYAGDLGERTKADKSPVTDADHAAEEIIVRGLRALTPDNPVVAEEEMAAGRVPKLNGGPFWLVDPLDGTKEFIKRNGEFTVNIALIENETPVAGVLAAPARGLIWRGHVGHGAERLTLAPGAAPDAARERAAINTRPRPASGARVLVSRSHLDPATDGYVDRLTKPEKITCGSALKFCLLAEGSADLYPRLGPMSEWDVAAGHAVLVAAGGAMRKPDGEALRYGQGTFRIDGFIATGDATLR